MENKTKQNKISVVIPMRNSQTTVLEALKTVIGQTYPVSEVIVIDNASQDKSIFLVKIFKERSKVPIYIIERKKNKGVAASYNIGVKKAKSSFIVFMHSDSSLPTKFELERLMTPLLKDAKIVATFSTGILPKKVWESYNFWEKCLFARDVEKDAPGFSGKFECVRKEAFLEIGGYDELSFSSSKVIGGEDADFYLRLKKQGNIVLSSARVVHLHYLGKHYKIIDWIKTRKLLARSYGRLVRMEGNKLPLASSGIGLRLPLGILMFLVKPTLAILPLIPGFYIQGLLLLFAYAIFNSKSLYTNKPSLRDIRIIALPFIDIFLVYYETFWMVESFFSAKKRV